MAAKKSPAAQPRTTAARPTSQVIPHESLSDALSAAQAEIENPPLDRVNPHFGSKYSTLSALLNVVRAVLPKHGLSFSQLPSIHRTEDGQETLLLVTQITHGRSKESVQGVYPVRPTKQDPQGFGSALTYARRYSLSAMVGVVGEEDDDGNDASSGGPPRSAREVERSKGQHAPGAPKPFRNKRPADCIAGEAPDCPGEVPVGKGWTKKDDSHPQGWATICDECVAFRKAEAAQAEENLSQDPGDSRCEGCGSENVNALGVCEECGLDHSQEARP